MAQVVEVGGHAAQIQFVAGAHVNSVGLSVGKWLVLLFEGLEDAALNALGLLTLALDLEEGQVLALVDPVTDRALNF